MNQAVEDVVMIHNINFNMLHCQKETWWFWSNYLAAAHHQTRGTAGTQKLTIKEEEMSQRKANLYNPNLGDVGLVFQEWCQPGQHTTEACVSWPRPSHLAHR